MDQISKYTEKELNTLKRHINGIYRQAVKEVDDKLASFTAKYRAKNKVMKQAVKDGKITEEDYKDWLAGQIFVGKGWRQTLADVTQVYTNADITARKVLDGTSESVFVDAVNHTVYEIDKGVKGGVSFNIYDANTVKRLLKDNPQMLPKWKIDEPKDYIWNQQRVRNSVTQGIIQGESIDEIANRLTIGLSAQNANKMMLFARTAMTGAQNAGRVQGMKECVESGIEVKKQWMAVHDKRTRDTHADLDGQEQDYDKPFVIDGMEIDYPGDPTCGHPELVYNCRCTLGWAYPRFAKLQNKGITYREWEQAHEIDKLHEYTEAKNELFNAEKQIYINDADHVFKNIWKQDVTYADYYDKAGSITAKQDYFQNQLDMAIANGDKAQQEKFENLIKELNKFESFGVLGNDYLKKRNEALKKVQELAIQFKGKPTKKAQQQQAGQFDAAAYSQARKDAAVWALSKKETDAIIRPKTGEVWKNATMLEKKAIVEYTTSYHKFNEPLRGIEYGPEIYKGVGNTDLNAGYANNGEYLNAMTDIINKCSYDFDIWLQRGCDFKGMDKFLQIDLNTLENGTEEQLNNALLGKEIVEYGFMSCGTTKGQGFSGDVLFNVYAPSGTKMMYAEPFSHYGGGSYTVDWDGVSKQKNFGSEFETIIQQGTKFRIAKVTRASAHDTVYVDIEVIDQSTQQRWVK